MTLVLKLISFYMIIDVCSKKFPTFYGGVYTLFGLIILQALTSIKVTFNKEETK